MAIRKTPRRTKKASDKNAVGKRVIAVVGATGAQGGGLVRAILNDKNGPFTARAITRNPNSDKAKALADAGADVVAADLDDVKSLKKAFEGAHGAFYADYAGWFDGNPTKLFPLPEKDRAARVIELAGGRDQVLSRARRALATTDFQWAAELSDYVLAIDAANAEAKRLKAAALSELGERQTSAIARNYYLSAAQYLLRDSPAR